MKIGDKVRIVRVERQHWRTTYVGTIEWIEPDDRTDRVALVRLESEHIEHTEHREHGRTLPLSGSLCFEVSEIELQKEATA